MKMICLGLNYRTAPVEIRSMFAVPQHLLGEKGKVLTSLEGVSQCLVLSTCNRMEIYYWAEDYLAETTSSDVMNCFLPPDHSVDQVKGHFYRHVGKDALKHLCRVVSGLDSMVLGETEIFGQVKTAYQAAHEAGVTKAKANKTLQKVFSIGKKVRSDSEIHSGATSVGSVAVELAEQIFGELCGSKVLILGAGEMSQLTARALKARGAESVFVANRSYDKAVELVNQIGGEAIRFDEWEQSLIDIDIVIASTSAPHYLITPETLLPLRSKRKYRSLFLIDISVPRNIAPEVNDIEEVYLYDIDTLSQLADEARRTRELEVARCENIIEQGIEKYFEDETLYNG